MAWGGPRYDDDALYEGTKKKIDHEIHQAGLHDTLMKNMDPETRAMVKKRNERALIIIGVAFAVFVVVVYIIPR